MATTPGSGSDIDANWGTFDASTVGGTGWSNIASWKAQNSDVVGWLRIPNTNINYPVVVGPNNNYYSSLGYDKNYSYYGVIWADSDTKFGTSSQISQNTVLYGHNWTNYTATPFIGRAADIMFGQLPSFHYINFCRSTPYIHYSTEAQSLTWKVFAVFYTEGVLQLHRQRPRHLRAAVHHQRGQGPQPARLRCGCERIGQDPHPVHLYPGLRPDQPAALCGDARLMRSGETISEVSITRTRTSASPAVRFSAPKKAPPAGGTFFPGGKEAPMAETHFEPVGRLRVQVSPAHKFGTDAFLLAGLCGAPAAGYRL